MLDEIELVMNEFTRDELIDFQLQYNLHYVVEELFGALEDPASGDITFTDELSVLDIIPDMFIPFVRRLQAKYRHDASITKGQMFMRPNIVLELYTVGGVAILAIGNMSSCIQPSPVCDPTGATYPSPVCYISPTCPRFTLRQCIYSPSP